jgi:hypothetical protein
MDESNLSPSSAITLSLDIDYTNSKVAQMLLDTIELYLITVSGLKIKSESAIKLTIKTMLMSLQKRDYATFFKYVDLFSDLLKQREREKNLTKENSELYKTAFGFLSQIKLLVDTANDEEYYKIVEHGFYILDEKNMFYLFFDKNTNEPITSYSSIENKEKFKTTVRDIVTECASNILKEYF